MFWSFFLRIPEVIKRNPLDGPQALGSTHQMLQDWCKAQSLIYTPPVQCLIRHALAYLFDRDLLNANNVKHRVHHWVNLLLRERETTITTCPDKCFDKSIRGLLCEAQHERARRERIQQSCATFTGHIKCKPWKRSVQKLHGVSYVQGKDACPSFFLKIVNLLYFTS